MIKTKTNWNRTKFYWLILIVVLWEVIAWVEWVNPLLLPRFSHVVRELMAGIMTGNLLLQAGQSIGFVVIGLCVSVIIGTVFVYVDYFYPSLKALLELLASVLHPLPGVAMLPIIVLWFGIGSDAVVMIIIHAVLWSYYLNVKMGFKLIDVSLIEAAHNNGATHWQLFRFVLIPESKEAMFTGLRIGWSRGWRGLISAEMIFGAISSTGGIGWFMYERRAFGDITGTYAGILLVAVIGILVEQVIFRNQDDKE